MEGTGLKDAADQEQLTDFTSFQMVLALVCFSWNAYP